MVESGELEGWGRGPILDNHWTWMLAWTIMISSYEDERNCE